jgi:hypothetical protein
LRKMHLHTTPSSYSALFPPSIFPTRGGVLKCPRDRPTKWGLEKGKHTDHISLEYADLP